jgi:prepilin-type N-terminal cleavage/methylation domain-containing protein
MRITPSRRDSAFTLIEIMIVVAVIGLLAVIAIPNLLKARERTQTNACINNLRLIDAAKQQWALETKQLGSVEPSIADIGEFLVRGDSSRLPECPANQGNTNFAANYRINAVTNPPTCLVVPADHVAPF